MAERYEIFLGSNRQFYFRLVAPNNEIVLQSEGYTSYQSAENGVHSCRLHSPYDNNYRRLISSASHPYFTLVASNGKTIGVSETYSSNQARENGISSVKRYGPRANVIRKAS